jgi:hypothetical protein
MITPTEYRQKAEALTSPEDLRALVLKCARDLADASRALKTHADREAYNGSEEGKREAREERGEKLRQRRQIASETALAETRAQAIRAIRRLLKPAIAQARKGKPALLRLILRSTR